MGVVPNKTLDHYYHAKYKTSPAKGLGNMRYQILERKTFSQIITHGKMNGRSGWQKNGQKDGRTDIGRQFYTPRHT